MTFTAAEDRYDHTDYRHTGRSGLQLPPLSLGLWQNFGDDRQEDSQRAILRRAFDRGVTHFDLANNYGPPYGRAEENFGRWMREDFAPYRDELVISTKAGYDMWPGPYGQGGGSRKYVLSSLDQSLARMGLDYVDIFYSHRVRPRHPARGDDRRARHGGAVRPCAVRRHLVVLAGEDARGGPDRPRPGDAAADPPAVVLDAQPLDRRRTARRARGAGHGVHRVLGAGPGPAHRPLPRRRAVGLARGPRRLQPDRAGRRRASAGAGPERHRPAARTEARSARSAVVAA